MFGLYMEENIKYREQNTWKQHRNGKTSITEGYMDTYKTVILELNSTNKFQLKTFTFTGTSSLVSMDSSIFMTPIPFNICPKTTCLPSKCGVGTVVMKNCEPLVFGPALAMLSRPTLSCYVEKEINYYHRKTMALPSHWNRKQIHRLSFYAFLPILTNNRGRLREMEKMPQQSLGHPGGIVSLIQLK